ncbi:polysaccharide deacetylase family protein [Salimicrobium flavidum]|uniref:Peptidoglycan/xylan/chitin deacetylase, PgdA/CDA1 family n=1 Tax=Salimicrobium flavidum TaxID=570947 RepID=A0A1N7JF90_9BACI|nr:polysaccharide deacetylase family protein [Salimicrobium flavidum]SIS48015.1 Peptidoglycan/xylan/chitin deacetylase, PgdA/CDA1 family [Salimicrobium flavidum]
MIRLKLVLASLLVVLLLLLSLLAWVWLQPEEEVVREEEISGSSAYPGMSIRTSTETDERYRVSIQAPVFREESINDRIRTYINDAQETFHEKRKNQDLRLLLERPATFSVSFDIHPIAENVHSIVLNVDSFTGKRDPVKKRAFMMDLKSGEMVQPADLFKEKGWEELRRMDISGVMKEEEFFKKVYMTNEELVFLEDGGKEVTVSYREVSGLLKEKWRSAVSVEGTEKREEENDRSTEDHPVAVKKESDENHVALTFDDGPHPKHTPEILDLLDEYDQTATFFLLGSRVDFYPQLTEKILEQGHEIGNHTWTHRDLRTLTPEEIEEELSRTQEAIEAASGYTPRVYRPPYGAENQKVKNAAALPSILWTLDTEDWKSTDTPAIRKHIEGNVEKGSVILMHDVQGISPEVLKEVLEVLEEKELKSVEISRMYTHPGNN